MKNNVENILTVSIAANNLERYLGQALQSCVSSIGGPGVIVVNDAAHSITCRTETLGILQEL